MERFIISSLVLSLLLTVVLNVGLWLMGRRRGSGPVDSGFGGGDVYDGRAVDQQTEILPDDAPHPTDRWPVDVDEPIDRGPRVKVYFPWKFMLAASIILTVTLNVIPLLLR